MKTRHIKRPYIFQIGVQKNRRKSREPIYEENFLEGKIRNSKLKTLSNISQEKGNRSTSRLIIVKYITYRIKRRYENGHKEECAYDEI